MREKTCLVIGGGRGMGAATAREMHKRGYRLSLMSPSESCEQLAKDLKAVALRGKAENKENLKSIVSFTMEKYGRIDSVLVHVGGPPKGDLLEIDDGDWDKNKHDSNDNNQPDRGETNVDESDEARISRSDISIFPLIPTFGLTIDF